jgi:hypothetical protein
MRTTATLPLTVVALGIVITGCRSGDRAPDCKAAGAAYAPLLQREIEKAGVGAAGADPATAAKERDEALSLVPIIKEALVAECEEKKWSGEVRRCVVGARTPDDLERCRTRLDSEAAAPPPAGAPGEEDTSGKGPTPDTARPATPPASDQKPKSP